MAVPKYRRPLNQKQYQLLKLIYKFRFVTSELLASENKNKQRVIHQRLKVLLDQEYIYRHFNGSYRLQNRPAAYCLAPDGIKWLKANTKLSKKVLHAAYRDRSAGQPFIEHCLNIFRVYNKFKELYLGRLSFFTKSEHSGLTSDAYLQDKPGQIYLMFVFDGLINSIGMRKKLQQMMQFYEDADETEPEAVLCICENARIEKSLQKQASRLKDYADFDSDILTTSLKALLGSGINSPIWTNVDEVDELSQLLA